MRVTNHAIDEAVKDFNVNRKLAEGWIRSNFKKSSFVANIISDEGKPCRLFGYNRIAFVLDPEEDVVITVYPRHKAEQSLRQKVESIIRRELRKIERKESALEKRVTLTKAELEVEVAQCKLKMIKSKSNAVRLAAEARIKAIEEYFQQLDNDVLAVKSEKRVIAKSVIAYMN